jgi:Domain of unknown function (DUF6285)
MKIMRDLPDITEILGLLNEARDAALEARCRAIAKREAEGAAAYDELRTALERFYGKAPDAILLARLTADICAGRFDPGTPDACAVASLLRALVRQRLRESNPDFLLP